MRRTIFCFIVLLFAMAFSSPVWASNQVVLDISPEHFAYYGEKTNEIKSRVTSFFVQEEEQEFYILDTLNQEIKIFHDNKLVGNIELPKDNSEYISLFVINDNTIALLLEQRDMFTNPQIILLDSKGGEIREVNLPLNEKNTYMASLPNGIRKFYNPVFALEYFSEDKIILQYANGKNYVFQNNTYTEYFSDNALLKSDKISMRSKKYIENISPYIEYTTYFEEKWDEKSYYAARIVKRTDYQNCSFGYVKLQYDKEDSFKDDLKITANGVYQLLTTKDAIQIIKHGFTYEYDLDIINKTFKAVNSTYGAKPIRTFPTREDVYFTAYAFAAYAWTYNAELNGLYVKRTNLPDYLRYLKYGNVSGIPYCWGGYQSIREFDRSLSFYQAGNTANYGKYKSYTAGVDCSGFVSISFRNKERLTTTTMIREFTRINKEDVIFMDIFNKPGDHALVVVGEDQDGFYSLEASITGDDKVSFRYRSNGFLQNYTAMRFDSWL